MPPRPGYSGIAIAFWASGVWAHHMFAVGLGAIADAVFASSTTPGVTRDIWLASYKVEPFPATTCGLVYLLAQGLTI
jgi:hypothetical protein